MDGGVLDIGVVRIARVQVRCRVVRREQDQGTEELQDIVLAVVRQVCEVVPRFLRLAAVAENDVAQADAVTIVTIGALVPTPHSGVVRNAVWKVPSYSRSWKVGPRS